MSRIQPVELRVSCVGNVVIGEGQGESSVIDRRHSSLSLAAAVSHSLQYTQQL